MDEQKDSFLPSLDKRKYFLFVLLNFIVISMIQLIIGVWGLNYIYVVTVTVLILIIQYPFLIKYRRKSHRLTIFYFAFIAFCFSVNFMDIFEEWNQLIDLDSIIGLFMRGGFFIIAGHCWGIFFFPIVLGVNWYFQKHIL